MDPLGVILAGGAATRFGAPKARARVGGRRIGDRVREALAAATPAIVAAGEVAGVERIADAPGGIGPLGGVLAALRRAAAEGRPGVLAAACDMPFLTPALFRLLRARGEASPAAAVLPASGGRRGFEPLCAWYAVRALPALEAMARAGEGALHRLGERAAVEVLPPERVREAGDPAHLFFNVNTMDDLREANRREGVPPAVAVIGRKNAGKTTLVVALLTELRRRGWRAASVKHGHHAFESDEPGRDSWRHFNQGGAEATLMVGAGKVALTMRWEGEPDPEELVGRFYAGRGYDLVVVEGYKAGPFPRIEVHRRGAHPAPLLAEAARPGEWLALVTDDPSGADAEVPVIPLAADGAHVAAVAELLERRLLRREARDGG